MISKETIEEVKQRARILDIVSESIPLKRQAGRHVGLCPFHSEKSPSFHVREDDGYYHCFGCGKSGNVFSFLMESRGMTFPEAVEYLAEKYGIEIKKSSRGNKQSQSPDQKALLYQLNDFALNFFRQTLQAKDPKLVEYVKQRGLNKEAFSAFAIGFAPLGNAFYQAAKGKFADELLVKSGLVRRNDRGQLYDSLRGRLVFPIAIDQKRIAGFGGRVIPGFYREDEKPPKYLNSPETEVYHKSSILYGFPQAVDAIRATGEVFVVEGYLDVIGLWQKNVKNVVATCGTALTEEHVNKLSRVAKKVVMLFDGDEAGRNASGKSFATFVKSPIDVWSVYLPAKEDPDSIAKMYNDKTAEYLQDLPRVSLLDAFIDYQLRTLKVDSVNELGSNGIAQICSELKKIFQSVKDKAALDVLIRQAAHRLRISESSLIGGKEASSFKNQTAVESPASDTSQSTNVLSVPELPRLERQILELVMGRREVYVNKVLTEGSLIDSLHPQTVDFVQEVSQILEFNKEEEHQKLSIKALLTALGKSWVSAWKESYRLGADKDVNFEKIFSECVESARRSKTSIYLEELQRQASLCEDPTEKLAILQQVLELKRRGALG
jgi:DNA primase